MICICDIYDMKISFIELSLEKFADNSGIG